MSKYDCYKHWYQHHSSVPRPMGSRDIEEQVLKDLVSTEDEIEQKQILDSFVAHKQRIANEENAHLYGDMVANLVAKAVEKIILEVTPDPVPVHRAQPVPDTLK